MSDHAPLVVIGMVMVIIAIAMMGIMMQSESLTVEVVACRAGAGKMLACPELVVATSGAAQSGAFMLSVGNADNVGRTYYIERIMCGGFKMDASYGPIRLPPNGAGSTTVTLSGFSQSRPLPTGDYLCTVDIVGNGDERSTSLSLRVR